MKLIQFIYSLIILAGIISAQTLTLQNEVAMTGIITTKAPVKIAVNKLNDIYLINSDTREILYIDPNGKISRKAGGYGWQAGSFTMPADLAVSDELAPAVIDRGNRKIIFYDRFLNLLSEFAFTDLLDPASLDFSTIGDIYLLDRGNREILRWRPMQLAPEYFAGANNGIASLEKPESVRISGKNIYILDLLRGILQFSSNGKLLSVLPLPAETETGAFTIINRRIFILSNNGEIFSTFIGQTDWKQFRAFTGDKTKMEKFLTISTNGRQLIAVTVDTRIQFYDLTEND